MNLPDRPDLEQYKRQAKELLSALRAGDEEAVARLSAAHPWFSKDAKITSNGPTALKLHDAQWVLAREHGFSSWSAMRTQIKALNDIGNADAFVLAATWGGNEEKAREMLALRPALASARLDAACVTGNVETVEKLLSAHPRLATEKTGARNWEPLLYVCFSLFLQRQSQQGRGDVYVAIARRLLEMGADPNTAFIGPEDHGSPRETALYGASGCANHPGLTELLLKAGADPQDGDPENGGAETIYHTAEFRDLACLRLLFQYGVSQRAKNYCLYRQLDFENPEGTRLFLENGAAVQGGPPRLGSPLFHAILRGRSVEVIALLLDAGADMNTPRGDGRTPFQLSFRMGREEICRLLEERGADVSLSLSDRFIGACSRADHQALKALLQAHPDLPTHLSDADRLALPEAARGNRLQAVELMLNAGFDPAVELEGNTALHWAAWFGHPEMTALLLKHGAPLEVANCYGGTPIATALFASVHCQEATQEGEGRRRFGDSDRDSRYQKVVKTLLDHHAIVRAEMLNHATPALAKMIRQALHRSKATTTLSDK